MDENSSLPWGFGDGSGKVQGQLADCGFCAREDDRQYAGLLCPETDPSVTPGVVVSLGQQPNLSEILPVECG